MGSKLLLISINVTLAPPLALQESAARVEADSGLKAAEQILG